MLETYKEALLQRLELLATYDNDERVVAVPKMNVSKLNESCKDPCGKLSQNVEGNLTLTHENTGKYLALKFSIRRWTK